MNRAVESVAMHTVRAREPVHVTVNQPTPKGTFPFTGRLLGEVWARGRLHHYRISMGSFVMLTPPHWLAAESFPAVLEAGLTLPDGAKLAEDVA